MIINIPDSKLELFKDEKTKEENSQTIRERVIKVRNTQKNNLKQFNIDTNSEISLELFENNIKIDNESKQLIKEIKNQFNFSIRNILKILRVSKTISDMEMKDEINKEHILEALSYKKN